MNALLYWVNRILPLLLVFGTSARLQGQTLDTLDRMGPANLPYEFLNQIQSDYEFESNSGILNIFREIYRDANAKSGYYYYLPAEYNLNWTQETGQYALYVNFKAADAQGRGGAVVTAELKPNITRKDLDIAKGLLKQDIRQDPVAGPHGVKQLVSMPLAEPPSITFDQIRNYGVNPEDIIVRTPTDFLDPIVISWQMDQVDDLLTALFNNVGLNGNLTLVPAGENMPAIEIPISLKIDDHRTYGQFQLELRRIRTNQWQNQTDYPILLKNLHLLRTTKAGKSRIYTWSMANREVPENAMVEFNAVAVPAFLDSDRNIQKAWLEYTVKPCNSCNATVREKILGGVIGSQINSLTVTTLTPLQYTGAAMMKIKVRSFQADPNGVMQVNLPTLTITKDFQTMPAGQLFLDDGESPELEFLIQLYLADGTRYESAGWQRWSDLELVIGEKQIRDLFKEF